MLVRLFRLAAPTSLLALCALALPGTALHAQTPPAAPAGVTSQEAPPAPAASVELALLDILREQGVITPEQYDALLAMARERAASQSHEIEMIEASLSRLTAAPVQTSGGSGGKLLFKSPDGKWSMGFKGVLQARLDVLNSETDANDSQNYSLARGRLNFQGNSGAENITYKLELNTSTQSNSTPTSSTSNFSLQDAYINWEFLKNDSLRFGQFKFPLGREELMSSNGLAFADRSIASNQFAPSYEPGAMVWGTAAEGTWEYYVASANGQGTGASNPSGSNQDGFRTGFRVVYNPLGPFSPEGASFQTLSDGSTKLSLGFAANQNVDSSGKNTVSAGTDTTTTDWEAQLMSGPWSLLTEFYDRTSDPQAGSDVDDSGSTVQLGYFLVPNKWELVTRRSSIDFDTMPDQTQTSIGVNYYIDKQNGKWQFDINKLNFQGSSPNATQVQIQYQLIF